MSKHEGIAGTPFAGARSPDESSRTRAAAPVAAKFTSDRGIVLPLEIHGPAHVATLAVLSPSLFELRVQVVSVEHAIFGQGSMRLHVCEFHGGPLSQRRQRAVVQALTALLESSRTPRAA
jgi:hypothetical protein